MLPKGLCTSDSSLRHMVYFFEQDNWWCEVLMLMFGRLKHTVVIFLQSKMAYQFKYFDNSVPKISTD